MKIFAITICINYSDYLECVACNRRHFDRWIVMTIQEDSATHEVCTRYGIEYRNSSILSSNGSDFNAVHNKGPVLNEALQLIEEDILGAKENSQEEDYWTLIIDADVLLPRHFRDRVEALPLRKGVLYAAAGRKICETREQFETLRHSEPWERLVSRYSQALGYFNLFAMDASPNRYPPRQAGNIVHHDDWLFTTSFAEANRAILPFTVIHTGPYALNWDGRVSPQFSKNGIDDGLKSSTDIFPAAPIGSAAAVIGYFPGGRWLELTQNCSNVYLFDQYAIHATSGDPMVEADRLSLRRLMDIEIADAQNLFLCGSHSVAGLAQIPDGSLDLLYLPGELSSDWLCTALPHWLVKLKNNGVICGDQYGILHWPEATHSIALIFGTPETGPAGFWWTRFSTENWAHMLPPVCRDSATDGVCFVNAGGERLQELFLSLYTFRKHWAGAIQVWHHGEESDPLRIACCQLGVELRHVSANAKNPEELLEEACLISPFRCGLFLLPGSLAVGPIELAFKENGENFHAMCGEPRRVKAVRLASGRPIWERFPFAAAQSFYNNKGDGVVVVYGGDAREWTEEAWELWCQAQSELALTFAPDVKVMPEALICCIISREEAADFQQNWLTWRFEPGVPVLLLFIGVNPDAFWLPGLSTDVKMSFFSEGESQKPRFIAGRIVQACKQSAKRNVVFISPKAAALPGAQLFHDIPKTLRIAVHKTEAVAKEMELTGNQFLPLAAVALFPVERIPDFELESFTSYDLSIFFHRTFPHAISFDLAKYGWEFPRSHVFANVGTGKRHSGHVIRRNIAGSLKLADDVVVISLPERKDRREIIGAALRREEVEFRFVDGVRVKPDEIQPDEIAWVGKQSFKMVAGFERYLCGMCGCRRAHLRVLSDAKARGLKSLLILEDDACFVEDWFGRFQNACSELPDGWMQLYLSRADFRGALPHSPHLRQLRGAYQTTAILYSAIGIEAAVRCITHSKSEVDHWMAEHLHPFGNSYAVQPGICFQRGGVSDIMGFNRGVTA
jgi:hypothetical protein